MKDPLSDSGSVDRKPKPPEAKLEETEEGMVELNDQNSAQQLQSLWARERAALRPFQE